MSRFNKYSKAALTRCLEGIAEAKPEDRPTAVLINVERLPEYELDAQIERCQDAAMKAGERIRKTQTKAIKLAEERANLKRGAR